MKNVEPKKILIIRLSSIGDILLATPLLRLLRRRFVDAQIDFIVKKQFADLLRTNPYLSNLVLFDANNKKDLFRIRQYIRNTHYDVILDIHKNFRSLYLSSLVHSKVIRYQKYYWKRFFLVNHIGNFYSQVIPVHQRYLNTVSRWQITDDGAGLDLMIDQSQTAAVREKVLAFAAGRTLVGMAPSAAFANKRWPWEYYAELGKRLQQEAAVGILLFGNQQDRIITDQIERWLPQSALNLAAELTLMETAAAIACVQLFITNDTGPMHIASALKIPTLAIFGPTTKELGFFPLGERSEVIEHPSLSCRPCTHMGRNDCPKKHFRCMNEILPQQVFERAMALLRQSIYDARQASG